jgi:exosortase A-associated hydrolase 1
MREIPLLFDVEGSTLFGVAAVPAKPWKNGVVIVVGGPQYRIGSHRQFVLLARALAQAGIAVFRFDCRGMGDSEGDAVGFEAIGPDIRGAIDAFLSAVPTVRSVVLWGLCDGATAAAFYATTDSRVAGLALYNPWVRTEEGESRTMIRRYYGRRMLEPSFWRKVAAGNWQMRASFADLGQRLATIAQSRRSRDRNMPREGLPLRLALALKKMPQPIFIGLSGNDFVAAEFKMQIAADEALRAAVARRNVTMVDITGADHTFSSGKWRAIVESSTISWLRESFGGD